jgi:soluble lytic murein transglycosylase
MILPKAASRFCVTIGLIVLTTVTAPAAHGDTTGIERQRELFREVYETVERGNWAAVDNLSDLDRETLEQYALWPDLRATWLRENITTVSHQEVESFVRQYSGLRTARELRYRHALNHVNNDDLPGYLRMYEQFFKGMEVEKLDCLALQAQIKAGQHRQVEQRAIELWLVGRSQVDECDPVFAYLDDRHLLGVVEYLNRYDLAIEERNFTLARWLAKNIDQQHVDNASEWLRAQSNPEDFLTRKRKRSSDEALLDQFVYATEQLTYRDPEIARKLWKRVASKHKFSASQELLATQHIALWTARDNLPDSYPLLTKLPPAAQSDEVLRWRARVSLRQGQWKRLLTDISSMPESERSSEEWRYWHAIGEIESGQSLTAIADLESLRLERSFYGFLAADKLGSAYALGHAVLTADETRLKALELRPEVIRARELFYVGQDSRGRSEWDTIIGDLSDEDKVQAAILADRWGWHSRAISTAASLGEYDDLAIRYPLPYKETFEAFSLLASISSTWAYGIARSESLFMRDVRSSAGAIGLMQLMPSTGRIVAKGIKLPYSGLATLVDPESNIRLGTTYLGQMAERYGGNYVIATAAYNAGPKRVDRWLPEDGTIDARIWIENIPFNETRQYVKRVLAAQTIFHWRLTGEIRRLSDELSLIQSAAETQQVASR